MAAKIRKGDKVIVLTGRDKGRTGEVVEVRPAEDRAFDRVSRSTRSGCSRAGLLDAASVLKIRLHGRDGRERA